MLRLLFVSLLLTCATACQSDGVSSEQKTKLVESYLEQANQYYAMGELDRANAQCIKGLALEPDNTKLKLVQAWTLQRRGAKADIAQAESMFRALQSTGDFRAVLGLGESLERKGLLFSESAANLRSGKRITEAADPKKRIEDLEAQAEKAWTEALAQYQRALELQKSDPDCFNGLVRVETLMGRPAQAYAWCEKLIEATHADLDFWNQRLTRADISAQDESRFRDLVHTLTKLETTAQMHAAELAMALDRNPEALAHLDAALVLDQKRAEIFSRRAQVQVELGHHAEAIKDIERFIALSELDSNHPDIQRAFKLKSDSENALRRR